MIFLGNCSHKSINKPEKTDSKGLAKWKEFKVKPDKIDKLIMKTKGDLKEGPR